MNNKTIYHFVVDQSGSMSGLENETIEGFNSQLKTIKKLKEEFPQNEYVVSVTYFEDEVFDIIRFGKVEEIPLLNRENYKPGSSTSLLDAIGHTIYSIEEKYGNEINEDKATVVIVILTDGYENSSRKYTYEQIAKNIDRLNETKKWIFTFLGAGVNAKSIADRIKIHSRNVASFDKAEYASKLEKISNSVRRYEENKSMGMFSDDFLDSDF
ncbi:MAG: VWA domain-containing protein [Bacteroidetes bacterium]|nr:VWA domain-containing protein [Bacteroidota bacterium]